MSSPTFNPKVPLESIVLDGKHQVRDSESESDQLQLNESVAEKGILTPLLFQLLDGGKRRPIDGHRRIAAATANELSHVPGYEFAEGISDLDCLSLALTSNAVRKNLTWLEKYQAIWRHHVEGGLTITEAAKRCGMRQSDGSKVLAAVQNNPKNVVTAFATKGASYRALYAIGKHCPNDDAKRNWAKRFLAGDLTVAQLESDLQDEFGNRLNPKRVRLVVQASASYEAILEELASIKKRILQLRRTDIDPKSIAAHLQTKQSEGAS